MMTKCLLFSLSNKICLRKTIQRIVSIVNVITSLFIINESLALFGEVRLFQKKIFVCGVYVYIL